VNCLIVFLNTLLAQYRIIYREYRDGAPSRKP
jgi:hypothetical protein